MEAHIHALLLLLIPVGSAIAVARLGAFPMGWRNWTRVGLRALVTSAAAVGILYLLSPSCLCGPGNNPGTQRWIPLVSALLLSGFIAPPWVRRALVGIALVGGFGLTVHFQSLVLDPDSCRYTGDREYILNSCGTPALAVELWHTPITGIYGLEKLK